MTRLDRMRRAVDECARTSRQLRDELHAVAGTACSRTALYCYRAEHSDAREHLEELCLPALGDLITCAEQLRAILRTLEVRKLPLGAVTCATDRLSECALDRAHDALARLESRR